MTDDEKILRFAGFTYDSNKTKGVAIVIGWRDPDGNCCSLPDTTDLTWLFKWCVPKLDDWGLDAASDSKGLWATVTIGKRHEDVWGYEAGEVLRAAIVAIVALVESEKAVPVLP